MAQSYAGHGHARLHAFLDDLGFERFGIRSSLAHGNPEDKGGGVHVFLSGEHRPYRRDRVGDFTGRLLIFGNVLWVIWGLYVEAYALALLDMMLCGMNLRGFLSNKAATERSAAHPP